MTYEKLSSNLNLLMSEARVNANELARRTGIPASSIKKIRNNNNPNPTLSTLTPIANYFSIMVSQLIGDISLPAKQTRDTNILHESNQQMIPIIAWDEIMNWPKTTKTNHPTIATERSYSQNAFGLRVEENQGFFPQGTILLVEQATIPQQNDFIIVQRVNQNIPSLKRVLIEDGEIFLKSILIDHHVILKSSEHNILGVIIEYRKYLR